jgi:hypothetical protein
VRDCIWGVQYARIGRLVRVEEGDSNDAAFLYYSYSRGLASGGMCLGDGLADVGPDGRRHRHAGPDRNSYGGCCRNTDAGADGDIRINADAGADEVHDRSARRTGLREAI